MGGSVSVPEPVVRGYAESAVLIAGGTSGTGLASAVGLGRAGVRRMALVGRDEGRGEAAVAELASRVPDAGVVFLRADVTDPGEAGRVVAAARGHMGAVDVLVSSTTSGYRPELLHRQPPERIAAVLAEQSLPPMLLTRAVLPVMMGQRGGSVITIASDAAKTATPGESVLGAAMAAIVMFTRTVAMEAKRHGIRANVITPSLIAGTPTSENVLSDGFSKALFEKAAGRAGLGVATPADIASLIVFLAGPGAARLTGQAISVNGGISAA